METNNNKNKSTKKTIEIRQVPEPIESKEPIGPKAKSTPSETISSHFKQLEIDEEKARVKREWWHPDAGVQGAGDFLSGIDDLVAKVIRTLVVIAVLILYYIMSVYNRETSAEAIVRIQHEISVAQQANITIANERLAVLEPQRENLLTKMRIILSNIELYNHCIELNETSSLPVNCDTVTLNVKGSLNWKTNANWFSQEFIPLTSEGVYARAEELLNKFNKTKWTIDIWKAFDKTYWIKPGLAISIAKADSSLGNELKTTNNLGNVGNNDRWDTQDFDSIEAGIEAIYQTLTNKYLKDTYTIGYLSEWGRIGYKNVVGKSVASCSVAGEYCYATSKENWNNNVINTMRLLHDDPSIDEGFTFRTNK